VVLQKFAATYVNIIRSLPLVLVIFWFYFLLPYIGQSLAAAQRVLAAEAIGQLLRTDEVARRGTRGASARPPRRCWRCW
jgi:His/Glu/Gln/Arg/opine family amino acid ABC transporter permease subunit